MKAKKTHKPNFRTPKFCFQNLQGTELAINKVPTTALGLESEILPGVGVYIEG